MVAADDVVEWGVFPFFTLGLMIKNKVVRGLVFFPLLAIQLLWFATFAIPMLAIIALIEFLEA